MSEAEAIKKGYEKYPEYTMKRPNPLTGKPDCPNDKRDKDAARKCYIKKLMHAQA